MREELVVEVVPQRVVVRRCGRSRCSGGAAEAPEAAPRVLAIQSARSLRIINLPSV